MPHKIVATIATRDESIKFRCKINLTSAWPQGFLTFPFQDWHGIGRKLATADRHTICIVRRRSRQMFARLCVAPAWLDPPASPLGNRCAQWNRGRQWNSQRTQRVEVAKLKALLASCILSSNQRIKTIGRGRRHRHPPPSEDVVRYEPVATPKFPFIREITGNFLNLMRYRLSCRASKELTLQWFRSLFPVQSKREFFVANRDISAKPTGNSRTETGRSRAERENLAQY